MRQNLDVYVGKKTSMNERICTPWLMHDDDNISDDWLPSTSLKCLVHDCVDD